jgi:hypothetical protein
MNTLFHLVRVIDPPPRALAMKPFHFFQWS